MAISKCNIIFDVNYTSSKPIIEAKAFYKITDSAASYTEYQITLPTVPYNGNSLAVTLPDIQALGDYDLIVELKTANGAITTKTSSFKIGNCSGDTPPATQDNTINLENRVDATIKSDSLIYSDPNSDQITNVRFNGDVSRLYTDSGFTTLYVANTELPINFILYFKAPDQDASASYQVQYNVKANSVWSS